MSANPFGLDDRTWNRIKDMPHAEFDRYRAAIERQIAAHQHAIQSTMLVSPIWAKHPGAASLRDLRTAVAHDARAVMLIETATSDWRHVGELEEDLIAHGWLDEEERSVVLDANGDPMLTQPSQVARS